MPVYPPHSVHCPATPAPRRAEANASSHALAAVHSGDAGAAGFVHTAAQRRKTLLRDEVMQTILKNGSAGPEGVANRWDSDEGFEPGTFYPYRKPSGRQLGYDLKASNPHETSLTELLMPEMAHDSVLPLQARVLHVCHPPLLHVTHPAPPPAASRKSCANGSTT